MERRAASIWREVSWPVAVDFRPYSPKLTALPLHARPSLRPLCILRNLVRLGCSMVYSLASLRSRRGGRGRSLRSLRSLRGVSSCFSWPTWEKSKISPLDPHLDADDSVGGLGF